MAHTLVLGITGTGKTLLSQRMARAYKAKGIPVLVLDPFQSANWQADYITDIPDEFMNTVFNRTSCAVFIDEGGDMIGRWGGVMNQLATRSRHYGHNVHFICQRAKMIDISVRTQCVHLFLFKQSLYDSKELGNDFVSDELLQASDLKAGEFLAKLGVDSQVKRGRIF